MNCKCCSSVEGGSANDLQEVDVKIISPKLCKQPDWYGSLFLEKVMICAGYEQGGKGTCYGDSGGPLQCFSGGRWTLVGLTSWGGRCAAPKQPAIYTNVASVFDWIKSHIPGIAVAVIANSTLYNSYTMKLWYRNNSGQH